MDKIYIDSKLKIILRLVDDEILGSEECPTMDYWHWPVLEPEFLPDFLKADYNAYGEVRLHL